MGKITIIWWDRPVGRGAHSSGYSGCEDTNYLHSQVATSFTCRVNTSVAWNLQEKRWPHMTDGAVSRFLQHCYEYKTIMNKCIQEWHIDGRLITKRTGFSPNFAINCLSDNKHALSPVYFRAVITTDWKNEIRKDLVIIQLWLEYSAGDYLLYRVLKVIIRGAF